MAERLELNKIHLGDSVVLLKGVPDNSVDLVFADPPYNLQLNRELFRPDQSKVEAVDDGWDKFASFEKYDEFTNAWLRECYRVLKPSGSFWVIGTYHNIFRVGTLMQDIGFWLLNDIIWIKTNPMPNFMGTRFNNAHETLIWATRSRESKYKFHYHSMKVMNDDLQMRSDWLIPVCHGGERLRDHGHRAHPTQKPEELLKRIILATSDPGDLVLDPFAGTGTAAAVAKILDRNFIAIEKDEAYVRMATERLENVKPLDSHLLFTASRERRPKITFGNLVEAEMVKAGEWLYTRDRTLHAEVQADASIRYGDRSGSIHRVSSMLSARPDQSGWSYWYVERNGKLVSIDKLKKYYIDHYLGVT